MSVRKFAIGLLVAAGAVAVMAGIATARIKSESKTKTVAALSDRSVSAKCGRGSEAVAGGFVAPGFEPTFTGRSILPVASKRTSDRKWKTKGYNFSATQSGKLKSIAYCDTQEPNLNVRSKTTTLPAQPSTGSATAKCPRGSEAVSGGWATPDGQGEDAPFAYESRRKGERKWKVSAFNNDNANAQRLVAYAYCDNHGPDLRAKSDKVNVPAGEKRSAKAKCRHGSKAYSGGFKGQVDPNASGPFAFTSKRTGGGDWQAKAAGNNSGTHKFKVYAYCK